MEYILNIIDSGIFNILIASVISVTLLSIITLLPPVQKFSKTIANIFLFTDAEKSVKPALFERISSLEKVLLILK